MEVNAQKLTNQQNVKPLLSILIPTKDRYETLGRVIEQLCTSISDPRLEVVVCDNSSYFNGQVAEKIKLDPRITYLYSPESRSIVDNTETGIAACSGEYICFIGDDDLVSPFIMQAVAWLKGCNEECLIYPPARYWWANVHFAKESRYQRPGAFWLPKDRDGSQVRYRSEEELEKVLARGGVAYLNLPRLYHGIVSKNTLEKIRRRFGRYVPGSSPDMALSVALALTLPSYISISYPVTVFGAAQNSGGGWTAARKHYGRISEQRHLPANILDNWDPHLPEIWSEQIIYPQTIHEVFSSVGQKAELNYDVLYASLIAYEPHIIKHLAPILKSYFHEDLGRIASVGAQTIKKAAGRSRVAFKNKTGLGMAYDLSVCAEIKDVIGLIDRITVPALSAQQSLRL